MPSPVQAMDSSRSQSAHRRLHGLSDGSEATSRPASFLPADADVSSQPVRFLEPSDTRHDSPPVGYEFPPRIDPVARTGGALLRPSIGQGACRQGQGGRYDAPSRRAHRAVQLPGRWDGSREEGHRR